MAYNPFLSMNEPTAPVSAEVLNPFMMTDAEPATFNGENPFATSNPFSDLGGDYEPAIGDTVPIDLFGGADPPGAGARHFDDLDTFGSRSMDGDRLAKPTELDLITTTTIEMLPNGEQDFEPQPQNRHLPTETQNLILSVTGQMEFTSSHLLDRIPPTRTPSPVSIRDIHSPSPTPELDTVEDGSAPDSLDINRNKPVPPRPPPARPPPVARPPPPRPAPPNAPTQPRPPPFRPTDDINLFDAPIPAAVKPTKEDILSLYSTPKQEEKQIDFLSDDITEDVAAIACEEIIPPSDTETSATTIDALELVHTEPATTPFSNVSPVESMFSAVEESITEAVAPMDCSEPNEVPPNSLPTSPYTDLRNDDYANHQLGDCEKNPFENFGAQEAMFTDSASDIFGVIPEDTTMATDDIFSTTTQSAVFNSASGFDIEETYDPRAQGDTFGDEKITALPPDRIDIFDGGQATSPNDQEWGASSDAMVEDAFPESQDSFDAFSAKFDSAPASRMNTGAWGEESVPAGGGGGAGGAGGAGDGFEAEAFDPFLSMGAPPPPAATPTPRLHRPTSQDSTDDTFSVFIRPKESETGVEGVAVGAVPVPALAPPPRPLPALDSPRVNPFDGSALPTQPDHSQREDEAVAVAVAGESASESGPPTPLFDEDVSAPLEDFPRTKYEGPGWEMHLRQPNKKKITGQRFWKKIFVRVTYVGDNPVVQLLPAAGSREPLQELPLQACYSVSDVGAQQFDQFGKIFTVKLQYVFYKERPGVRPGQVTKAERLTSKLSQFAAYAMQGDYQGVREFGSDLRKLGLPLEHAPQVSQLFKLGSLSYEDVLQFSCCVEEALFRLSAHRDRALTYKMEEVQITAVDELFVEQDAEGSVLKQIARVRIFFLGFLSGMPDVELGVNDLRRQGREVVGRHDIIPVVTEEWIRVEDTEFHACVQVEEFHKSQIIKFKPPDACYIEVMRFRVRPPRNRELPLQLKAAWCVHGNKVELRADVLVPGFASRALGQVPCEDVALRFPIPDCWIYLFRVEKHFRYGSVKSAHRRTGKIKGIERFLGAVEPLQESLIEVTSGHAKYEHQHRAIVWRMPRLPKEGQGAYTTHNLVCRMALTSYDQVPAELARWAHVQFSMPAATASHVTVRSVSLQAHDSDPPEKCVRYLARHEYTVGIERTSGAAAPAYALAASVPPAASPPAATPAPPDPPSSDSDSD